MLDCSAPRCARTTDVEGPHGELSARLANGLRRDHADSLTGIRLGAAGQVTTVARPQTPTTVSQVRTDRTLTVNARVLDLH